MSFDGTLRVNPPLRSKADRKALRTALADGVINSVVSDHRPESIESHDVEFALSPNGISGIESVFAALCTACPDLELARLVDSISNATRRVYQLPELHIELNVPAKITWFTPKQKFLSPEISGGVNNPWKNQELSGVVYGTINGERVHLND